MYLNDLSTLHSITYFAIVSGKYVNLNLENQKDSKTQIIVFRSGFNKFFFNVTHLCCFKFLPQNVMLSGTG